MTHQSIEEIAAGLSDVQRQRLLTVDKDDVDRFHYHHFKGQARGLFQVAIGWQKLELSPLGLAVRTHLLASEGRG